MLLTYTIAENVAIHKKAWMYNSYSYYSADRAVDGLKSDLSFSGGQCAASENGQTAKWGVDLGEILRVHHILIQYATRNRVWSTYVFVDLIRFYVESIKFIKYF